MTSRRFTIAAMAFAAAVMMAHDSSSAQTALVAHRSHSGSDASFAFAGTDDFGLAPERIDSVQRLTDSTVIKFTNEGADTVIHRVWSNPKIPLDSLSRRWPGIRFIDRPRSAPAAPPVNAPGQQTPRSDAPNHDRQQGLPDRAAPKLDGRQAGAGRSSSVALLLLAGAAAVPLLAVGIHRAERGRTR